MAAKPLALPPAAWDFGASPTGPAMTALDTTVVRIAAIVRGLAIAYVAVQVLIWHAFYLAHPWSLWGPVVALTWGGAAIAYLRRGAPPWPLICVDTTVYVMLAISAGGCVPLAIRGQPGSWLYIVVASQFVVPTWFAPRSLSLPLTLASVAAFGAGGAINPAGQHVAQDTRIASVALMFSVVAVHQGGSMLLCSRATKADAALAAADRDAQDQYVVLSRNIERREHDRLLHDTVLNTLTAIARSGDTETITSACRDGIGLLEAALSEPAEPAAVSQPGGDPLAAIGAAVKEIRGRGLAVHLEVTDGVSPAAGIPAQPDARPAGVRQAGARLRVPAAVARAMAHATREALLNVAEHAGTGEAWVTISPAPLDATAPGGLQVTIRDAGAGFDPGRVDLVRLGVRRSITERVADVGGSASVQSAPGKGTVVSLFWPAATTGAVTHAFQAVGEAGGQTIGGTARPGQDQG